MSTRCYIIYYILFLLVPTLAMKGCDDSQDDPYYEADFDNEIPQQSRITCHRGPIPPEAYKDVTAIEVNQGELPYMVYFKDPDNIKENQGYLCAGSMIHIKAAITASSCFEGMSGSSLLWLKTVSDVNFANASEFRKLRRVKRVIEHPNFTAKLVKFDICVVQIYTAFTYNNDINLIALPKSRTKGENCTFASWGSLIPRGNKIEYFLPKLYQMSLAVSQCSKDKAELCADGDIKTPYMKVTGGALACNGTISGIAIGGVNNLTNAEGDGIVFTDVITHRRFIKKALTSIMTKPKFSCCFHKQTFFNLILISVLFCLVL